MRTITICKKKTPRGKAWDCSAMKSARPGEYSGHFTACSFLRPESIDRE